ncbi:hypothetical protein R6Q59_018599 [Mikania micrantha]|uniref:Zinc transporter n=1 Tax=Mikania micrantha TaxID=192012 RepID=A0A5N6M0G1_9ASTR|nr:hypothetical protein E3N88_35208 [Mikania micrantha]
MCRYLLFISLLLVLVVISAAHGGGDDDDDGEKPNLRSRSLILVKIWCLIIAFFATFIGGVSPYFLKWNEGLLVVGTQFAGGVFLGTAMMHFLSDANETFEDLTSVEYPFAFMLACAGYLLTMLADAVISYVYQKQSTLDVEDQGEHRNGNDGTAHHPNIKISSASSLGDSFLLILALCFHSVFEGIAIGIADSEADAWKALWTISLHKIFAAIAMGIALLRMIPDRPLLSCASYAFMFGISTPIGVAIGIAIDATVQGRVADWIFAISMGIACGVFIYVSINHLLRGYQTLESSSRNYKLLAVTLGLGVIAVVMIWDT